MNTISGMVTDITPQHGVSKKTGKPYSIWFATVDGQQVKMGFNKPTFNVGDTVSLDTETNRYGDVEVIKPGSRPAPAPRASGGGGAPASAPSYGAPARKFPVDTTSPEMSIIRQNALTNANALLKTLMEHGIELCGKDTYDEVTTEELAEFVIETAYKFVDFSSGQREVKAVRAMERS